jgi:hypothetical protein
MAENNYERMIKLAQEVFDVKNDPEQLDINQEVIGKLKKLHPSTVLEYTNDNGPVAWVLLIPATRDLMNRFISGQINEKQLFDLVRPGRKYDALYLCSAMVLDEYRRKGITKKLVLDAIDDIMKLHSIKALFIWPFTDEGERAAESVARITGLPLYKRKD